MSDIYIPAWANDPDDPRQRLMEQLLDAVAVRLDAEDGLELCMRYQAGTAGLYADAKIGRLQFIDLIDNPVEIRDAGK